MQTYTLNLIYRDPSVFIWNLKPKLAQRKPIVDLLIFFKLSNSKPHDVLLFSFFKFI